ncbi:MAG: S41 family peptidase [Bacteroidales bacterium]|nr:S41 family peptidase [Bacteroidales bacterium]
MKPNSLRILLPLLLMLFAAIGVFVGSRMNIVDPQGSLFSFGYSDKDKLLDVINYISSDYVDEVDKKRITEQTIEEVLTNLDPHSTYIPPTDLGEIEESMQGNFFGIGVQFRQWHDTVVVIRVINGGPSMKAGLQSGDRIVQANGVELVGLHNDSIMKILKGPQNTQVEVKIFRKGLDSLLNVKITRGVIPFESLIAAYWIDDSTAYFKIDRFAATTTHEFRRAAMNLGFDRMKTIILDLQNNGGGLLSTAVSLTDEFLDEGKTIVYTQGRKREKNVMYSSGAMMFADKDVVVLVNESSASASEILAGAIQDNDRGYIVGRRTFGKGLVQEQITLSDNSAIRLTVARYYTPTGRCIQKPYEKGKMEYYHEVSDRYLHGEMVNSDSVSINDSLKYITAGGRVVYGGGGIMPDIFVPIDTSTNFYFYNSLLAADVLNDFSFEYYDSQKDKLLKTYPDEDAFIEKFKVDSKMMATLKKMALEKQVGWTDKLSANIINEIHVFIKARIASNLYGNNAFYKIINQQDKVYTKAVEFVQSNKNNHEINKN